MKSIAILLTALAISGCSSAKTAPKCDFKAFAVEADGKLSTQPVLQSPHVKKLDFDFIGPVGPSLRVELSDIGSEVIDSYLQSHPDTSTLALFCGDQEISRPKILTPPTDGFVIYPTPKLGEP